MLAESGVAEGRLLPGAEDPSWEEVPLHLRQHLRGYAYQLVTPVQGVLKKRESRSLLSAVRPAGRMRVTGAQWRLLLTAPRRRWAGVGVPCRHLLSGESQNLPRTGRGCRGAR